MAARISVYASRELQAILAVMRSLDRDVKKQIRSSTRTMARPAWQQELAERISTKLDHRVLVQTARVKVSDRNVMITSASVGRRLKGGLLPSRHYAAIEFGASGMRKTTYQRRSRKGGQHSVTRNTLAQLPARQRRGRVVYPAAASFIPRIASLWVQTTVRTIHDAFERTS